MRYTSIIGGACVGLAAAAALAQTHKPPEESQPLLAGPSVNTGDKRSTIVQQDFDGHVKLPEPSPEVAAIALLSLDDGTRKKVDEVLARRERTLTRFLGSNLLLLQQLDTAGKSGDKLGTALLAVKAAQELKPLTAAGPLQQQVARVLPPDQARRFDGLMREFWDAVVADRRRVKKPDGKLPGRVEIMAQVKLESLGREIEHALKGMLGSGDLLYRVFLKGITLDEEQGERVRQILEVYLKQSKGDATEQQNQQLFLGVMGCLRPDQQKQFMTNARAFMGTYQKPPARPAPKPAKK